MCNYPFISAQYIGGNTESYFTTGFTKVESGGQFGITTLNDSMAYLTSWDNDLITKVNLINGTVSEGFPKSIPGTMNPHGLYCDATRKCILVAALNAGSIIEFDYEANHLRTTNFGSQPLNIIGYKDKYYIADRGHDTIYIADTVNLNIVGAIKAKGIKNAFYVDMDVFNDTMYFVNAGSNNSIYRYSITNFTLDSIKNPLINNVINGIKVLNDTIFLSNGREIYICDLKGEILNTWSINVPSASTTSYIDLEVYNNKIYIPSGFGDMGDDNLAQHILVLSENQEYHTENALTICDSELPYDYYGNIIPIGTENGELEYVFTSTSGHDSIVTLTLIVHETYKSTDELTICESELPYDYYGQTIPLGAESGMIEYPFSSINGCDSIIELTLIVNQSPSADFSASIYEGVAPLVVNFTDDSNGIPTSWSWNFGDGIGLSQEQNPSYTYTQAGIYTISLNVENSCGTNETTKMQLITVGSSTGIENISESNVVCSPNPVNDKLYIKLNEYANISTIELYDNLGSVLYKLDSFESENIEIDLSNINSDIILIKITTLDNNQTVKKIVKY